MAMPPVAIDATTSPRARPNAPIHKAQAAASATPATSAGHASRRCRPIGQIHASRHVPTDVHSTAATARTGVTHAPDG